MNKIAALRLANELTKSFIEHQTIASSKVGSAERGEGCAEFIIALNTGLTAYFEKIDSE